MALMKWSLVLYEKEALGSGIQTQEEHIFSGPYYFKVNSLCWGGFFVVPL